MSAQWPGGVWKRKEPIKKVDDPIKLIEGVLSKYKGKMTSVEMQHEATKIWKENTERKLKAINKERRRKR